ncbi:CbtB-domain containing protein [Rubrobacter aplysinae]|uniref:CbtB-domain containing protein n=1 Tax=Rubrobacter aplysinae TaxID=909625 RepID=UPI00064C07D3|nr:CbtB-domain containing protein [Rubrobacter aplysinae]
MHRGSLERVLSPGGMPWWSWVTGALLVLMLFVLLSASGELLVPLLGSAAEASNYLHEFFHDGRHLLAVPCH